MVLRLSLEVDSAMRQTITSAHSHAPEHFAATRGFVAMSQAGSMPSIEKHR
jgi:hypothetical protein